jgi:glutamate dehydrogenase (NADP+)
MCQNSLRYFWSFEEVDCKLKTIMTDSTATFRSAAAEYGVPGDFGLAIMLPDF